MHTLRTPLSRALLTGALLTTAITLSACDTDESTTDDLRGFEGTVPSELPKPCGDAIQLPKNTVMVARSNKKVTATTGWEDPQARMSGATAWEYSCSCTEGAGACQVQVVGGEWVQCFSESCTTCKLEESKTSSLHALALLETTCDPDVIDDDFADQRAELVAEWAAEKGYPQPNYKQDGHDAKAPDGYGLVMEVVGGRALTYAVPEEFFDEKTSELLGFVGPGNDSDVVIAQVSGGNKLTCDCDGNGDCSFEQSGLCKGPCAATGAQKGCYVKSKKKLKPIHTPK